MLHVKALFAGVIVGLLFNITWDLMQANNFNFVSVECLSWVDSGHSTCEVKSAGSRHTWRLKFDRIDRLGGAPKVGALGDIGHVGGNQSDFGCPMVGGIVVNIFLFLVE